MSKRSISPNNKGFKKICLVSSAAFSAASCVWPWTAPIGAGLGLYASIDSEERVELELEFADAVAAALHKTEENLTTVDSKEIIKELSSDIVRPDNLDDLISNTETYRRQYCTALDRKRIVDMFDVYFKEEVCRCEALSNYYLLASGTITLEAIKSVSNALAQQDKKLSFIEQRVVEYNSKAEKIFYIFRVLFSECGFVLISVAGCLCAALAFKIHVPFFYIHVIISYASSSLLTPSMLKVINIKIINRNSADSKHLRMTLILQKLIPYIISGLLLRLFIYTAVSIGAYLIIVESQSLELASETILTQLNCISIGCIISSILRVDFRPESVIEKK